MRQLDKFLASVHAMPSSGIVFNPWRDKDPLNDIDARAPAYRLDHLTRYMSERLQSARIALVAEAPGYQGCKFSGLAMTSERALLESNSRLDNEDQIHFAGQKYRTSKLVLTSGAGRNHAVKSNALGCIEPTASVVWGMLLKHLGSHDFVLWNSFAWHPHPKDDMLDNRTPIEADLERGADTLKLFLDTFKGVKVVAVGRKAEGALTQLGVPYEAVRHPARGGATQFRQGVAEIARKACF